MAGRPRTRAKQILDDALAVEDTNDDNREPDAYPVPPQPGKRGASAEWMQEVTRRRMEMAKTDPAKRGGRPKTKLSKREAEELAIEQMLPKALLVLRAQLESKDERVAQTAAVKVLEYVKGKPTQKIESDTKITAIRYESAAWHYGQDAIEVAADEVLELEPGDQ